MRTKKQGMSINEKLMNIKELIAALDKLSSELNLATRSIADRCNGNVSVTIGDLHFLNELDNLESHLDNLLQVGAQLKFYISHGYCQWITRQRDLLLPAELDDKTIYSLYLYSKKGGDPTSLLEPTTEITCAIKAICHPTPPLCHECGTNLILKPVELKDGLKLRFRRLNIIRNMPEDAISSDNIASFCLGMDINGKRPSPTLLRYLMQKRCVNILEHLIRMNKKLPGVYPPENLLLTVLYEMDGCPLLPIIMAIEETFPGTIKSAEDASCRNALWYTLRHHSQLYHVNLGRALDIEDVEQYLLSKGCDPAKASNERFSWQTMKRVINVVKHYET